jgi:hypothetical protein
MSGTQFISSLFVKFTVLVPWLNLNGLQTMLALEHVQNSQCNGSDMLWVLTKKIYMFKGTVQRKLRWVKSGIN